MLQDADMHHVTVKVLSVYVRAHVDWLSINQSIFAIPITSDQSFYFNQAKSAGLTTSRVLQGDANLSSIESLALFCVK